jgi:multiple sugar transport system permease protein
MKSQKPGQWDRQALILLVPSLVGFALVYLIPFIGMVLKSFSRPEATPTLRTYQQILCNEAFQLSVFNAILFMAIGIPALMVFSYAVALCLHELKTPPWVKLLLVLPIALPSGASIGFFRNLFGASYDSLLYSKYNLIVLVIMFIWKYTGYNLLIFLSGFKLMRGSVLDSAKIDGANYRQIVWHIILPLSAPYIVFAGIVTIINSFKIFKEIYILQGSYPSTSLYLFQHFINNKFSDMAIDELSTAATLFSVIILLFAFAMTDYDRYQQRRIGGKS